MAIESGKETAERKRIDAQLCGERFDWRRAAFSYQRALKIIAKIVLNAENLANARAQANRRRAIEIRAAQTSGAFACAGARAQKAAESGSKIRRLWRRLAAPKQTAKAPQVDRNRRQAANTRAYRRSRAQTREASAHEPKIASSMRPHTRRRVHTQRCIAQSNAHRNDRYSKNRRLCAAFRRFLLAFERFQSLRIFCRQFAVCNMGFFCFVRMLWLNTKLLKFKLTFLAAISRNKCKFCSRFAYMSIELSASLSPATSIDDEAIENGAHAASPLVNRLTRDRCHRRQLVNRPKIED